MGAVSKEAALYVEGVAIYGIPRSKKGKEHKAVDRQYEKCHPDKRGICFRFTQIHNKGAKSSSDSMPNRV